MEYLQKTDSNNLVMYGLYRYNEGNYILLLYYILPGEVVQDKSFKKVFSSVAAADSLMIHEGFVKLIRSPEDEPEVVCTYI